MPNLLARLVIYPEDIIQIDDVYRLSCSCFKRRKKEKGLSVICIDGCHSIEEAFVLGESFVSGICGYGKLEHHYICSIQYDDTENLCCSVNQIGKRPEHFEIRPDPKDIAEIKSFEAIVACELVATRLSEHSVAVLKP